MDIASVTMALATGRVWTKYKSGVSVFNHEITILTYLSRLMSVGIFIFRMG